MYQPKNVLLTGGAGFIGSNVIIYLVKKYPSINFYNYDMLDYCSSLENLTEIENLSNYKFIKGDICSSNLVNFVVDDKKIDTIMHFAAKTHICNSFIDSVSFTKTNVIGTHVLLEAARHYGIKRFIHVSTDEVVGEDLNDTAMDEDQKMNPSTPYSSSKAGGELLAKSYYHSFGLPVIISRGNNVFGKHQYVEKMIPKFINQLMRNLPITIHGNGENYRNFLHVSDVVKAFECLLFNGVIGETYNIGGSNEFRNIDVARKIIDYMEFDNTDDRMISFVRDRHFNDFRYNITSEKLKSLGWKEEVSFEECLKETIEWYKENSNRFGNIENAILAHPEK